MITHLEVARDRFPFPASPEAWQRHHEAFIAKQRHRGRRVAVHLSLERPVAYVDHGQWVLLCECGAGNACDPDWPEARCFACGAVHTQVQYPAPADRAAAEALLLARPHSTTRNWWPHKGETMEYLAADNARRLPHKEIVDVVD